VLYVAATRASHELIVVRSNYKDAKSLPFLQIERESELHGKAYMNVVEYPLYKREETPDDQNTIEHRCAVTELTAHLTEKAASNLGQICADLFTEIDSAGRRPISLCSNLKSGEGMCEDVSELNGLIIPGLYERSVRIPAISEIERVVSKEMKTKTSPDDDNHPSLLRLFRETNWEHPTIVDYTRIAVMYYTLNQSLDHKIAQIPFHDWLREDDVAQCHRIMKKHITDDAVYECVIHCSSKEFPAYGTVVINGRMDVVSKHDVYELKCVQAIAMEHKLQLLVYAWMWHCNERKPKDERMPSQRGKRRFFLLNVLSGERWEVVASYSRLKEAVELMLESKYGPKEKYSDLEFIDKCLHNHPRQVSSQDGTL
jgi:hypothetical protein